LLASFLTSSKYSSEGCLIFIFPFSVAVLKRVQIMEFFFISCSTFGTVVCSVLIEKGSRPASSADVSSTIIRGVLSVGLGFILFP